MIDLNLDSAIWLRKESAKIKLKWMPTAKRMALLGGMLRSFMDINFIVNMTFCSCCAFP
jgi:hypothetical protein